MIPLALVVEQPWAIALPGWEACGAILGLAFFSTALAYTLYFRILSTAGATNVLLVTLLVPVSAILLGIIMLGEQLEMKHATGMGLIGLGFAAIDGRLIRLLYTKLSVRPAKGAELKNQDRTVGS